MPKGTLAGVDKTYLTNFLKEYNQGVGQPTNKVPRLQVWDLLLQKIMLVKDTVDSFLNWKGSYIKSAVAYKTALKPFTSLYGERRLADVTIDDVSEMMELIKKKYSEGHVFNIMTVLKMYLKFTYYAGHKSINPELIRPRRSITIRAYPNEEDVDMMSDYFDESNFIGLRNSLLIKMLFETGCRISEILSVELKDIDVKKNYTMIITRKSNVPRYIMWREDTHKILLTYLALRLSKDYKSKTLFINKNGGDLGVRGSERMFENLCKKIGTKYRLHDLRHACAHYLISKNANVKQIGDKLGHSPNNPVSAMHYLRFDKEESLENLRKFI